MSEAGITMDDAARRPRSEAQRRELARQRSEAYRDRRRRRAVLVTIELEPRDLAALERLALLAPRDRDPQRMASAAAQFLAAAPCVAAIGDAADPSPGLPLPPEHAGWRRYRKARALDPAALDRVSGAPLEPPAPGGVDRKRQAADEHHPLPA
jgi:hypothetical protein